MPFDGLDRWLTLEQDILGDGGMNVVRLRLWVNPKAPYDGMPTSEDTRQHQLTRRQVATTSPTASTTPSRSPSASTTKATRSTSTTTSATTG